MWHALYSQYAREVPVSEQLIKRGLSCFCPTEVEERRVRRGHRFVLVEVTTALFPRYSFVKASPSLFDAVRSLPPNLGKVSFVSAHGEPLPIPDEVIEGLREVKTHPPVELNVGDRVRMDSLGGLVAVISSVKDMVKTQAVSIWVEMFGSKRELSISLGSISEVLETG
jgi:transcription antitermination factor NusG